MDERTRILISNERVKTISSVIANLGTALTAAALAKWWSDAGLSFEVTVWLALGGSGITVAVLWLRDLRAES